MDAEDYFNLLPSPVRPRHHVDQLGADCDPDSQNEGQNGDNDSVYESPIRSRLQQPSATLRGQGAAAVVLPLAQEGGRDNREGESVDSRGRHGVFEVK
ncbi:hypothetical protein HIM_08449 [Hirsutella minnesotensis 3608]|uniref:Uncharacterized protein n=1 Tax=Hirsutella minnesotensis 3608 TaxID=1043627 RepID=A0A0F8A3P4_9HYPO|nr:hypothetical protein HIM_11041 [Hirsutella minnesotensis 3608]KJZ69774.1 hypothetical protein HIM_10833 [Hirsutella minnesotensis 3608]KJZ71425.1 hypothetical protein HIM_09213 [Hirsutella minnesotensis 3608]KJZ72184.1 hypothetical protein HIM_08449 [Hirsutella minnesotensis 3608]